MKNTTNRRHNRSDSHFSLSDSKERFSDCLVDSLTMIYWVCGNSTLCSVIYERLLRDLRWSGVGHVLRCEPQTEPAKNWTTFNACTF